MKTSGTAFFVRMPRTIDELRVPHFPQRERPYEIVKIIELSRMDYENFSTDLLVSRQFIEEHANFCGEGEVFRCLFVCHCGHEDGILVLPERGGYVKWAAYI